MSETSALDAQADAAPRRAGIIVNPTKVKDTDRLREECTRIAVDAGWQTPFFAETTIEDPGLGQTERALDEGCTTIFAAGGDGTVRVVGTALAGTDVELGLMPSGTGNLLARNMGVPVVHSPEDAFHRALTGKIRRIDVGRVHARFDDSTASNDSFLIMAGFGLDGDIMEETSEKLKARIGWLAYPARGIRFITERPERMQASFDAGPVDERKSTTLLVGSCGRLTGGVQLMPDADPDDGLLDYVWLSADGLRQWVSLSRQILFQRPGDDQRVERGRAKRVVARAMGKPRYLELDGDVIGQAREVQIWLDPLALKVRIAKGRDGLPGIWRRRIGKE